MKKKLEKVVKLLLVVAMLFAQIPIAFAASATVGFTGADTANVGANIELTLVVSNISGYNGIAGFGGELVYDSDYLEYVSSTKLNNFGTMKFSTINNNIVGYAAGDDEWTSGTSASLMKFVFKAKKEGTTTVKINDPEVTAAVWAADIIPSTSNAKTITISTASNNANLGSLSVSGYNISPAFNKDTTTYNITIPYSVNNITISAVPEDSKSTVNLNGNVSTSTIAAGSTGQYTIKVTAQDGTVKSYVLKVTKEAAPAVPKSSDNDLKSLSVDDYSISPSFNKDTTDYTITVPNNVNDIKVNAVANDTKATVSVTGNTGLQTGENKVQVKVTAEDGSTKVYNITVNKQDAEKSSDNDLKGLGVSGYELSPTFDKDNLEYTVTVPNEAASVIINALPNDDKSKVEVTGNTNLVEGENTVTVKVTAEDGSVKEYTIIVTKTPKEEAPKLDSDATLKSLTVGSGTLSPNFSSSNYVYSMEVSSATTSIDVNAIANSSKANVQVIGNTSLKSGINAVQVLVTAEDGTTHTYVINVNRKSSTTTQAKSSDNYLANLGVSGLEISPTFNKDNSNYTITVPYDVETLDLYYTTSNSKAKVEIIGNDELLVGKVNTVQVKVTAEDGSVRIYTINATRSAKESDNKLKTLSASGFNLSPSFDKDTYYYTMKVDAKTNNLDLTAIAENENAKVEIIGNSNFKVGTNTVLIKVTDESGFTRVYQIDVEKPAKTIFGMSIPTFLMFLLLFLGLLGLFFLILFLWKRRKKDDDSKSPVVVNTPPQPQVPIIDFKPEFNFGSRNGTDDDVVIGGGKLNQGSISTNTTSEPKKMLEATPEATYEEIDDDIEQSLNDATLYDETITKDELVRAIREGMKTKNTDKLKMLLKQDEVNQLKKKIKREEAKKTRSGRYDE